MNILVIGEEERFEECKTRFGSSHDFVRAADHREAARYLNGEGVLFDFAIRDRPDEIVRYATTPRVIFLNTVKTTLRKLVNDSVAPLPGIVFGFNGLPTFINYAALEVSMLKPSYHAHLRKTCQALGCEFHVVADEVGMVSPRVISMIINEAYYAVAEKTASREDVDLAMKLGTNYPYGPFEWCDRIGVKHIYEVLEALLDDTKDDRYTICSVLKDEYLTSRR